MPVLQVILPNMSSNVNKRSKLTPRQSLDRLIRKAKGSWRDARTKNGGYRVQPTRLADPPPPEHLLEIATGLGMKVVKVLPPNSPGACSGKYQTYLLRDPQCQTQWKLVCGQGGNGGHRFEHEVFRSLKSLQNGTSSSRYPLGMRMARKICQRFGIKNPKQQILSVSHVAKHNTNRAVGFSSSSCGVGDQIADIRLKVHGGKTYHISLKAKKAATVASVGAADSFRQVGNRIVQTGKHQTVNNLLRYLGVDMAKLSTGLINAKNKTRTKLARSFMVLVRSKVGSTHSRLLRQFLVNAIGFGYHAASQDGKAIRFISRRTTESIVGSQVRKVELSYPRYYSEKDSSKQLSAWITTNKARFKVELRNTQGKILPQEVKVTVSQLHNTI